MLLPNKRKSQTKLPEAQYYNNNLLKRKTEIVNAANE